MVLKGTFRDDAETAEQQRGSKSPAPLEQYLPSAARSLVELAADPDQIVRVEAVCRGACPAVLHGAVLPILRELVGSAVKYGLYQRLVGCVRVELISGPEATELTVADDGWSLYSRPSNDQGLRRACATVASLGGTLALQGGDGVVVNVFLPYARPRRASDLPQSLLHSVAQRDHLLAPGTDGVRKRCTPWATAAFRRGDHSQPRRCCQDSRQP